MTLYEKAEAAMREALTEAEQGWPELNDLPDEIAMRILARIAQDRSLEKNALTLRLRSEQCWSRLFNKMSASEFENYVAERDGDPHAKPST
jgi:hypothetical protein